MQTNTNTIVNTTQERKAELHRIVDAGLPIFPCNAKTKSPLTPQGFKDASTDSRQIRHWLTNFPNCLWGVPTGTSTGLYVLDVDVDHDRGIDGFKALSDSGITISEGTPFHTTRRGGRHYFFKHQSGLKSTAGAIGYGVDTRGEGGYVIWWPTEGLERIGNDLDNLPPIPETLSNALKMPSAASKPKSGGIVSLLKEAGIYKAALPDGLGHEITCPWVHAHTDKRDAGAVYFQPSDAYPKGGFKCQHAHCNDKHLDDLLQYLGIDFPDFDTTGLLLTKGSEIEPEKIDWLWDGWLAAGKLHILAGVAGTGKTTIALAVAATLTTGGSWPDGAKCTETGDVVLWTGEDGLEDTIVPRLMAAGAAMDRIHLVTGTFDPAVDMPRLAHELQTIKPRLLIFDPISSAVSNDSHKNSEVRRDLQPAVDMAAGLSCAVVGITHFTKGTGGKDPLERVTGSLAFGAMARLVWATIKPAKGSASTSCRMIRAKSNISADGGGFDYSMTQEPVPGHAGMFASVVSWGDCLEGSAYELAGQIEDQPKTQKDPWADMEMTPRDEAVEFLAEFLKDGPKLQKEIVDYAGQDGHTLATLRRAKKDMGITSKKVKEGWLWSMPNQGEDGQGAHISQIQYIGKSEHLEFSAPLQPNEIRGSDKVLTFDREHLENQVSTLKPTEEWLEA